MPEPVMNLDEVEFDEVEFGDVEVNGRCTSAAARSADTSARVISATI